MGKYFKSLVVALIIGLFLSNLFLNQYNDYNGIKVSGTGYNLYFIEYGIFSSRDDMEKNTIELQNYVYNIKDDKYYVYIGITMSEKNKNKIIEYYNNLGYNITVKEYQITNKKFIDQLKNYDEVLKNTTDTIAISSVINQILIKYEEVVINGGKN